MKEKLISMILGRITDDGWYMPGSVIYLASIKYIYRDGSVTYPSGVAGCYQQHNMQLDNLSDFPMESLLDLVELLN
jgi:hypothetical protein